MNIAIIKSPYNTHGKGSGGASGPQALVDAGLTQTLTDQGHSTTVHQVELTPAEESQYGGWNRVGVAGGHLADLVATVSTSNTFVLGLLADCNGVLGMLGGLQQGENGWPRRIGLVYIDAHGDYNTPETSPSGMLGGMPVAIASGKALHRLRKMNKLIHPLQPPDIVMAGMRDLDDLEHEMIEADNLEVIREQDLIECSSRMHNAMRRLSARSDVIYVHVDLDILDPSCAPAAGLPSTGGLTGAQLGKALAQMLAYPKAGALAIVSYRADADSDKQTLKEVLQSITIGTQGLKSRGVSV